MNDRIRQRHKLSEALSVFLPGKDDTLLLRACLQQGPVGRRACESWLQSNDDPAKALRREFIKSILPLLYRTIQTQEVKVRNDFMTVLRTAALREELRTKTYSRICEQVLSTLVNEELSVILIKGAALGETVYEDSALRHSHDIELLVKPNDQQTILRCLLSIGFAQALNINASEGSQFVHLSGLPLVLHNKLFRVPFYNRCDYDLWSATETKVIYGIPTRVLMPEDALLHVCGQATYPIRQDSFRWMIDAWFIIAKYQNLDWDRLLNCARQCHLSLPLSVMIDYLANEISAPIPVHIADRLLADASNSTMLGREIVFSSIKSAPKGGARTLLLRARGLRGRLYVVQWMLFPSPAYLLWAQNVRYPLLLPFYYFRRPLKYCSRRLSWTWAVVTRRIRSKRGTRRTKMFRVDRTEKFLKD